MNRMHILIVVVLVLLVIGLTLIDFDSGQQPGENLVSIFENQLTTVGVERVGQPIEGFDAFMLARAFPKLENGDFDGVQTREGHYEIVDGEIKFERDQRQPISSAEQMVSRTGYGTLLINVSERLGIALEDEASVEKILTSLFDKAGEVQVPVVTPPIEKEEPAQEPTPTPTPTPTPVSIPTPQPEPSVDTTAPVISNVSVSNITETSATVTWMTDEQGISKVEYAVTTPATGGMIALDTAFVTDHSVNLSALAFGTLYYIVVSSTDVAGNTASFTEQTFTTDAPPPISEQPLQTSGDLLAHWKFDDGPGTTVFDASGNGNTGVLVDADPDTIWVTGLIDGAVRFDGVDDYASFSNSDTLNVGAVGESYSISIWYNRGGGTPEGERNLISKGSGSGPSPFLLRYDSIGYPTFRISDGAYAPSIRFNRTITTNEWHHIVAVRDAESGLLLLYVDGESNAGGEPDTTKESTQNDNSVWINRYVEAGSGFIRYERFKVDDVRIYNRVLTASEVTEIFNTGKGL